MAEMEHPFYSLSKKPETGIRCYENNGSWLKVTPSVKGLATIYDKDILIYCVSQIIGKIKRGEPVAKRVRLNSRDLLIFTNRGTSGRDYAALTEALDRLAGTRISTNIRTGDEEQFDTFGLINAASVRRKHGLNGRLLWCDIELSDWVFNAIKANEVLTLHPSYFRLRKPLERRVYEIARKHCGKQDEWKIGLTLLLKKTGSQSPMKRFRQMIRYLADNDHLPDYSVVYVSDSDQVIFRNREAWWEKDRQVHPTFPRLEPETFHDARTVAPGYDVYHLEQEWRDFWVETGRPELVSPDKAFLAFCKRRYEKKPNP